MSTEAAAALPAAPAQQQQQRFVTVHLIFPCYRQLGDLQDVIKTAPRIKYQRTLAFK